MSAFAGGVKRTLRDHRKSVASDPKRYFATANYRIAKGLFDRLVDGGEWCRGHSKFECLSAFEIDRQLDFSGLH
jgi:hypothetical protein